MDLLKWVGLGDRIDALPPVLSGGEKQRAAIARAVIARPQLLLADAPTGNVDPHLAHGLRRLFIELNKSGTTVVIATHDITLMDQYDCRRLVLHDGRLHANGLVRHDRSHMTEWRTDLQIDRELMTPRASGPILPRGETPIVPKRSIAGRA